MQIRISKGVGTGPTELSAFDQALVKAGIANFNLIYLSSIVPPGSDIQVEANPKAYEGQWGDKLYVVMAQSRTIQRNQEVWAGVGWIQDPKTKAGLFVEHEGHTESEVRADIKNTLQGLAENRGMKFGAINMLVGGIKCTNEPVCALVAAVFESAGWQNNQPYSNPSILRRLAKRTRK